MKKISTPNSHRNIYDVIALFMIKAQQRTIPQNSSLHLWMSELSEILNSAGLDQRKILKPSVSIPWTMQAIKEQLVKPVLKAYNGKTSTTQLTTKEIDKIVEIITRHLGEKFGVSPTEFPSIERQIDYDDATKADTHVAKR